MTRCRFHLSLAYCSQCDGVAAAHETLAEWSKRTGVRVSTPRQRFNSRVVVDADVPDADRATMFALSDYRVTVITGGSVWLDPVAVVVGMPSEDGAR